MQHSRNPLFLPFPRFQLQRQIIQLVQIIRLVTNVQLSYHPIIHGFTPGEVIWLRLVLLNVAKDFGG